MAIAPKTVETRIKSILDAWTQLAPSASFGGMTLAQFTASVQGSTNARNAIAALEAQMTSAFDARDTADKASAKACELAVNGVIGSPEFGPDCALYEAMGYIRKSERKSGLTRKKNATASKSA